MLVLKSKRYSKSDYIVNSIIMLNSITNTNNENSSSNTSNRKKTNRGIIFWRNYTNLEKAQMIEKFKSIARNRSIPK